MRLTPPKHWVFWVSVVLAVLGVIGAFISLPVIGDFHFWFVVAGFVLLALGNTVEGL